MPYEAANALARAVVAGSLRADGIEESWAIVTAVPVRLHALDSGADVIAMAQRLGRQSACDAAYLVLTQTPGASYGRSTDHSSETVKGSDSRFACSQGQ